MDVEQALDGMVARMVRWVNGGQYDDWEPVKPIRARHRRPPAPVTVAPKPEPKPKAKAVAAKKPAAAKPKPKAAKPKAKPAATRKPTPAKRPAAAKRPVAAKRPAAAKKPAASARRRPATAPAAKPTAGAITPDVVAALTAAGGSATLPELVERTGKTRYALREELQELIAAGRAQRAGAGLKTQYQLVTT